MLLLKQTSRLPADYEFVRFSDSDSLPSLLRSRYQGRHATLLLRCVTTLIAAAKETIVYHKIL